MLLYVRASASRAQSKEQGKAGFGGRVEMTNGVGDRRQRLTGMPGLALMEPGRL